MIGVGINESVVLSTKTKLDDKGSLDLCLKTKQETDLYAALVGGVSLEESDVTLKIFPIGVTDYQEVAKTPDVIGKELQGHQATLCEFLSLYMTDKDVKDAMNISKIFLALGINEQTKASLPTQLVNKEFVHKVFVGLSSAFINAMKPHFEGESFRIKLVRSSKDKHYARLPYRGKFPETWLEPMLVPKASSKIAFSKWEIENGRDNGDPVVADTANAGSVATANAAFAVPDAVAVPDTFAQEAKPEVVAGDSPVATPVVPAEGGMPMPD